MTVFGTATQSSTYSHSCNPTASKAIDGNNEGVFYPWCSVTHTNKEAAPWWEVNLRKGSTVYSVVVFNRLGDMDRLSNFDVILKDKSHNVLRSIHEVQGDREIMGFEVQPVLEDVIYVRVQLRGKNVLSLAEVEVYGR